MICLFDRYRPIALCTAFFTAYVIIRTVPQSINGQTRQKKKLVEQPHIDHGLLRRHLTLSPQHRALIESYLAPYSTQCPCIEVPYSARSEDGLGRKYCFTVGGQRLPKEVRLLLFGKTHVEVDLKGSFYELVRRLSLSLLPTAHHSPPLMNFVTFSPVTHTYALSGKNARTPSSDYPCASSTAPLTLHITTLTP